MSSLKIVIVHFNAIEKFPPAVNFLRYLGKEPVQASIKLITTGIDGISWAAAIPGIRSTRISWKTNRGKIGRLISYCWFNLHALLLLITTRPSVVMYFETLSSWAPVFYKRFINKGVRLFIHYHEYNTPEEYKTGMALNRYYHRQESFVYSSAEWISHTNPDRMRLFLQDNGLTGLKNTRILPNYPPAAWSEVSPDEKESEDDRLALVYVGALSPDTTYVREMAEFVAANPLKMYWDIYSGNHDDRVLKMLGNLNAQNILFKGSVQYDHLPGILKNYDIGVILYKGNTANFEFNAPNKYFEYHVCGLNVIFSDGMKGMLPFAQEHSNPWTRKVEFQQLNPDVFADGKRAGQRMRTNYTAEAEYSGLAAKILNR